MKKVVLGLLVLGLTHLAVAQRSVEAFDIALVPAYNAPYLEAMSDGLTPAIVSDMQFRAAVFNPAELQDFDTKSKGFFEVVHKASNGEIITFYDKTGRIVSTLESFRDVELPLNLREQVFQGNGNWKMAGNKYKSIYEDGQLVKKIYKVKLQDGRRIKTVTIDVLENKG